MYLGLDVQADVSSYSLLTSRLARGLSTRGPSRSPVLRRGRILPNIRQRIFASLEDHGP